MEGCSSQGLHTSTSAAFFDIYPPEKKMGKMQIPVAAALAMLLIAATVVEAEAVASPTAPARGVLLVLIARLCTILKAADAVDSPTDQSSVLTSAAKGISPSAASRSYDNQAADYIRKHSF
uniref:Uncharacterized protein n=1 Tax=Kalanchoe fedtschenkoi TaxID=63787 RepID=A0A7N0UDB3_KALFE